MLRRRRSAMNVYYWAKRRVCVTSFRGEGSLRSFVSVTIDGRQVFYSEE